MNSIPSGRAAGLVPVFLSLLGGALCFCPSVVLAQEAPEPAPASPSSAPKGSKRVLVGKLEGDKNNEVRALILDGVNRSGPHVLIDDGPSLALESGASPTELATVAAEEMADVVVVGSTKKQGKGFVAKLSVYDGLDGHLIETVEISGSSKEDYETKLSSGEQLGPVIAQAEGWPRPEETAPAETEDEVEEEAKPRPSPLRILAGIRLYSRSFRYTDGIWERDAAYRRGENYTLATGMMPRGELHWYPAAHFGSAWTSHVGVVAGYELGVGSSVRFEATPLSQSHDLFYAGLRARMPLGAVTLGLQSTFASHSFSVSGDEMLDGLPGSLFPDVSYSQIELGGDLEWRNEKVILGTHASLNLVLGAGEIGSSTGAATYPWFPATSTLGGDFGVYAGWQLSPVFDLLFGADFRAYGLDFGTSIDEVGAGVDPSQVVFAGGATDRYISFWGGLAIHWPGQDAAGAADLDVDGEAGGGGESESEDDFGDFEDF